MHLRTQSIISMPKKLINHLRDFPKMDNVFNPWRDVDKEHDSSELGPQIRSSQLLQYLSERIDTARIVLCAEAIGYRGGHFSGIPMTSERILLGHAAHLGVSAESVIVGGGIQTSNPSMQPKGWAEPTATTVWSELSKLGINTREVVLWNAFAFHPTEAGALTNRKPTNHELQAGRSLLTELISLYPDSQVIAVGTVAHLTLESLEIEVASHIRHPAYGGANEFRAGLKALKSRMSCTRMVKLI